MGIINYDKREEERKNRNHLFNDFKNIKIVQRIVNLIKKITKKCSTKDIKDIFNKRSEYYNQITIKKFEYNAERTDFKLSLKIEQMLEPGQTEFTPVEDIIKDIAKDLSTLVNNIKYKILDKSYYNINTHFAYHRSIFYKDKSGDRRATNVKYYFTLKKREINNY